MSVKENLTNDPAQFYMYQQQLISDEIKQKALEYSSRILNLQKC